MANLEFYATYGTEKRLVEISKPFGAGDIYHITIGKFFNGTLFKQNGEWIVNLNNNSGLTSDDIFILGEMMDDAIAKEKLST